MEQRKPLNHVMAGLLIGALLIVISLAMTLLGNANDSPGGGWIPYLIIIAGLVFFINMYARSRDNFVSFGDLFSYGFKATAVFTLMMVLFLVLFSFLFPDFKEKAIEVVRNEMDNQRNSNEEQTEKAIELMSKYFWVFAIGGTMLGYVIVGAIGSLIGAAVTKKRPTNPFEQQIS